MKKFRALILKQTMWAILVLFCFQGLHGQEVKTVFIPGEDLFKAEENATRETVVKNLSEDGIYHRSYISSIDGFLYLIRGSEEKMIRLSPQGEVINRFGRKGEGPGEYMGLGPVAVRQYKNNIALFDTNAYKIIIYKPDGEFVKEFRLGRFSSEFFVNKNNEFVFTTYRSIDDQYFHVYNDEGKFLYKFGDKISDSSKRKKVSNSDTAGPCYYISERDGLWAAFSNRYGLRYYENNKLKAEINGPDGYFRSEENEMQGRKFYIFKDKARQIGVDKNRLHYIYLIGNKTLYCDVFDLKDYMLQRRIVFKGRYFYITHFDKNVFYSVVTRDDEETDEEYVALVKLEILDK
jgi:hypothetical protein